jgi:glycosyltransferase involved in cell wall biosynthesis|tara:strand:- start:14431 stop:15333 length:903 start_codon:yes stop_codon:yes gene_type:complete
MPEVSIIIPTYNRADLVGRAIKSVLNQTFQDFEIIVVNNYSKDNTLNIISSFNDSRIKIIDFQNNGVIAKSRNKGLMKSTGKYIAFLDDDDAWEPGKLERNIGILKTSSNLVGAVYTGMILLNHKEEVIKEIIPRYRGNILNSLLIKNHIESASAIILKKECFERVGKFDESENLGGGDDWDMWIRVSQCFEFEFNPELLVKIYFHGKNITTNTDLNIQRHKAVTAKYKEYIGTRPKKVQAGHYQHGGEVLWRNGSIKDGIQFFIKSIAVNPLILSNILYFIFRDMGFRLLNQIKKMKKV